MTPVRRHRVVVLLLAPVVGFDATIAPLVFGEARDRDGSPLYEVVTCSPGGGPVTTTRGYGIVPAGDLDELTTADTVVVPGTRYPPARERGTLDPEVAAALDSVMVAVRRLTRSSRRSTSSFSSRDRSSCEATGRSGSR